MPLDETCTIKRDKVFADFHRSVGLKPFGPDFLDSLAAVMKHSACLDEAVWAWVRWRSWGNSSVHCVDHWNPRQARFLKQLDCIVDISSLRAGLSFEDLTKMTGAEREAERSSPLVDRLKSQFSRAFAAVEARGNIRFDGQKIAALVEPAEPKAKKVAGSSNFSGDKAFMEWWKVAGSSN